MTHTPNTGPERDRASGSERVRERASDRERVGERGRERDDATAQAGYFALACT